MKCDEVKLQNMYNYLNEMDNKVYMTWKEFFDNIDKHCVQRKEKHDREEMKKAISQIDTAYDIDSFLDL